MERRATGHTGLTWITVISGELALTAGTSFGLSGTVSATRRPAGRCTVAQGRSDCIKRPGRVASPVIVDPREGNIIKSGVLLGRKSDGFAVAGSQSSGTATFWRNTGMGSYWLDAAAEIKGNRIRGSLSCRNNHPAPTNGGHHSTVPGHRRGQCAAAAGL